MPNQLNFSFACGVLTHYSLTHLLIHSLTSFACGGELTSALTFVVEITKGKDVAYWSGYCLAGTNVGSLLGLAIAAIIRGGTTKEELETWGWRIPFLLTPVLGLTGLWIRQGLEETQDFTVRTPLTVL